MWRDKGSSWHYYLGTFVAYYAWYVICTSSHRSVVTSGHIVGTLSKQLAQNVFHLCNLLCSLKSLHCYINTCMGNLQVDPTVLLHWYLHGKSTGGCRCIVTLILAWEVYRWMLLHCYTDTCIGSLQVNAAALLHWYLRGKSTGECCCIFTLILAWKVYRWMLRHC